LQHHEVFSRFPKFDGMVEPNFSVDFLGARIRAEFVAGLLTYPTPTRWETSYPPVNEDYLEWIDLLESVVQARGSYTMVELGAGYGRWVVRAAFAVRQYNNLPCRLIAVEAEPLTFRWMDLHFRDNGLDPRDHCLIHAAGSDRTGHALFYIGGLGAPFDRGPGQWYGQALVKEHDLSSAYEDDGQYAGFRVRRHKSGWRSISIRSVTLKDLMADLDHVDFLDMDIEGHELPVIHAGIGDMDQKVKRVHVGTHSAEIEDALRWIFRQHGWRCLRDYPISPRAETSWGVIEFGNGVQSWVNPRLE
jgi:FkbM family methyltransferase